MNRNKWITLAVGGVLLVGAWKVGLRPVSAAGASGVESKPAGGISSKVIAGAGRVEPYSEEIRIGSELDGRLKRVPVEEGQEVRAGQILAELDNGDYAARVALAKASVAERSAVVDRLVNGSRREERAESKASVREAEVIVENAKLERDRREGLLGRGAISRTEFDTADREYRVALARLEAVRERHVVVDDQTRPEDLARAKAELAGAQARLVESEALLAKTILRSPITGIILRKKLKTGESVSSKGDPPIVTLGEVNRLRIRVDVDENDVAKVRLGQAAWATATAYGDRKFTGKVVQIGQALGRKNIRTDEPSERVDVKILETLVELDRDQRLPIGLRVDAFIQILN
jgi:HlyD family secretion protein